MIHIRMRNQDSFPDPVKSGNQAPEQPEHLFPVQCVSALDEENFPAALNNCRIASARGFNQDDLCTVRDSVFGNTGREGIPAVL